MVAQESQQAAGAADTPDDVTLWICISANRKFPGDPVIAHLSRQFGEVAVNPPATHAYGVLQYADGEMYAIEAVPHAGVHLFDPKKKDGQIVRWYRVPGTSEQIRGVWDEGRYHLGRKYDFVGLALTFIFLVAGRPARIYLRRPRLFCSALWAFALRWNGLDLWPGVHIDTIYPALLEAKMLEAGWYDHRRSRRRVPRD